MKGNKKREEVGLEETESERVYMFLERVIDLRLLCLRFVI